MAVCPVIRKLSFSKQLIHVLLHRGTHHRLGVPSTLTAYLGSAPTAVWSAQIISFCMCPDWHEETVREPQLLSVAGCIGSCWLLSVLLGVGDKWGNQVSERLSNKIERHWGRRSMWKNLYRVFFSVPYPFPLLITAPQSDNFGGPDRTKMAAKAWLYLPRKMKSNSPILESGWA